MKVRQFTGAALAIALAFALTGCSDNAAHSPDSTASTHAESTQNAESAASSRSASVNPVRKDYSYYASSDGKVRDAHEDTTLVQRAKDAAKDAGNSVRRAADNAGDAVRDAVDDAGDTMKKAAEDITGK